MGEYLDANGIRFTPALLEFYNIESGKVYRELLTVQNISPVSKNLRFYGAKSDKLILKVKNPTRPIAPGLQVQALIEYATESVGSEQDRLIISVDGDPVEIPIRIEAAKPILSFEPTVDFGSVVAVTKVITRDVTISNRGGKAGDFHIKYSGQWPINIIPMSGTVPAKAAQIVKVEYVTKTPGTFNETALVQLDGRPEPMPLQMKGVVVERKLELLSLMDEHPIGCIRFGKNYYGSDRTETAILYNNSPEPVSFVAVLKDDAVGQELGLLDSSAEDPANLLTQVFSAIPNQGTLPPFAKVPIFFRFSPRWNGNKKGWARTGSIAPRQDLALFMHLELVGATSQSSGSYLEIALTAVALPVDFTLTPTTLDFGHCVINETVDKVCVLANRSSALHLEYNLRRIAPFSVAPHSGRLAPGASENLLFTFSPKQGGTSSLTQQIDVLGPVADDTSFLMSRTAVIHTASLKLLGQSSMKTIIKPHIYNPGFTPTITNEIGLNGETTFRDAKFLKAPRAAILESLNIHHYNQGMTTKNGILDDLVAFPNDRAKSLRPSKNGATYRTLFNKTPRYKYTDHDYACTDLEDAEWRQERRRLNQIIVDRREARALKIRELKYERCNNDCDLGIPEFSGMRPPVLRLDQVQDVEPVQAYLDPEYRVLSSKEFDKMKQSNAHKPAEEGLNAVPIKREEILDCSRLLTPQELHQVVIGPTTIEFGDVCLRSVCIKELNIVNNLNLYVHVVVDAECRELRQSSPLSQVIPPCSRAVVPIIFESNTKGLFQRSLTYSINGHHKHHVTVTAHVVQVALHIHPRDILVLPSQDQPVEAGYRSIITLENKLNQQADFSWEPIVGDRGTAFSVRPASGTVEPDRKLDCEVVFHPSYLAPDNGMFALHVHGGKSSKLKCTAKFGAAYVDFTECRIVFGSAPLLLTTTKTAQIINKGHHHAFFEVVDTNPFPGLTVSPKHGHVPVGGTAELAVSLTPNAVIKFDTKVVVQVRGCTRVLELRVGGAVTPPSLDINVQTFNLGGVPCGSQRSMAFELKNMTTSKAKVEFDLSKFPDFTLQIPGINDLDQSLHPGIWMVSLAGNEVMPCTLHFKPTEVASYDFHLPVTINDTSAPSPEPPSFPATPAPSGTVLAKAAALDNTLGRSVGRGHHATPKRRIIATALRQALLISHERLDFELPSGYDPVSAPPDQACAKQFLIVNNSDNVLGWAIDLRSADRTCTQDGVFRFLHSDGDALQAFDEDAGVAGVLEPGIVCTVSVHFCPNKPGIYTVRLPIVMDDNYDQPYSYLLLYGQLKEPKLWFEPSYIVLTPAPLKTTVTAELTIYASDFTKSSMLDVTYPEVESHDGTHIKPLSITWPNGNTVHAATDDQGESEPFTMPCQIAFISPRPISFTKPIVFSDSDGHRFELLITAAADNCLLTCYPFVAQHRCDYHIVRELATTLKASEAAAEPGLGDTVVVGEAMYKPCRSPLRSTSRPSTSATSSDFQISTSSYEGSKSFNGSTLPNTPRDGALIKPRPQSEHNSQTRNEVASRSFGSVLFPDEDSDAGIFHAEVVLAVQRWFSACGWPGGQTPIHIPRSLRRGSVNDDEEIIVRKSRGGSRDANCHKGENKTVLDMIAHLLGRSVPGVTVSATTGDYSQQIKQLYWQHDAMLVFIRSHGGCPASVRPEYLLAYDEYRYWYKLQTELLADKRQTDPTLAISDSGPDPAMNRAVFDAVSKRAWTDVLLQVIKTLVMSKITPKCITLPDCHRGYLTVNREPLCSNIYGLNERSLLAWLNHCYESYRQTIWRVCQAGGPPAARWVVNFDYDLLDGLVLGAVIGAYCPFVFDSHLRRMYTRPATPEQCLHNALIVVNVIEFIGIQYDIQAIDITDPNPISLMLLCTSLCQQLYQYLPKNVVDFQGPLHSSVSRQVRLSNPSGKPLHYNAKIVGRDARDFSLPKGYDITIGPRGNSTVNVEFHSRFRRPTEAVLLLVGKRLIAQGSTVVFELRSSVCDVVPRRTIKCESPCYELHQLSIDVTNPFEVPGKFRVVLLDNESANKKDSSVEFSDKADKTGTVLAKAQGHGRMQVFFLAEQTLTLDVNESDVVTLDFLPFNIGRRRCYVLFVCEQAGEFVYQIEATGLLPKPTAVPNVNINDTLSARVQGPPMQDGEGDNTLYWKFPTKKVLHEVIHLPIVNAAKCKAVLLASQKLMSEKEFKRRKVTGTLTSDMLIAKTLQTLTGRSGETDKKTSTLTYQVTSDSVYFTVPQSIEVKLPSDGSDEKSATFPLTVEFRTEAAGHYSCRLVVRGKDDVRVVRLECFATTDMEKAVISFKCPVHETSTQNIPITNTTNRDWHIRSWIDIEGFQGPNMLLVSAKQTCSYPLTFKPTIEKFIKGELRLKNLTENSDQVYEIHGKATPALAMGTIALECAVGQRIIHQVRVPNATMKKLMYQVQSDVAMIHGESHVTVWPGQMANYDVIISPQKRGQFRGVLTFTSGAPPLAEVDSDGEEVDFEVAEEKYQVWLNVDLTVSPAPPVQRLLVVCACQNSSELSLNVSNPFDTDIDMEVRLEGPFLTGPPSLFVKARDKAAYDLLYEPAAVGQYQGGVIFYHEMIGELWYELNLLAEPPTPTSLPDMVSELGRWCNQEITLRNSSDSALKLIPRITNPLNYNLGVENTDILVVLPGEVARVPLYYCPSTIGSDEQSTEVIFSSEKIGDWCFSVRGIGEFPTVQEPISVSAPLGTNATMLITFRNPLDLPVLVDIRLTDKEQTAEDCYGITADNSYAPFGLLLKQARRVAVGARATIDIPIAFTPTEMRMYEALCVLNVWCPDGTTWPYDPKHDKTKSYQAEDGRVRSLQWLYPVHGVAEVTSSTVERPAASITCQARNRVEETVELIMSGVPAHLLTTTQVSGRTTTPPSEKLRNGRGSCSPTGHISYEMLFNNANSEHVKLQNCLVVRLVSQDVDEVAGRVTLKFHVIFAPSTALRQTVPLLVRASGGGVWRYIINFTAMEPEPDDVIELEAVGLGKPTSVGFRLTGEDRRPVLFEAYFDAGSDPELSVCPRRGELLSLTSGGTLFTVTFTPSMYGKVYKGRLLVKTAAMQWTYTVRGTPPQYCPPRVSSTALSKLTKRTLPKKTPGVQFPRKNLQLDTTAVSSPIKGCPVLLSNQNRA